MKGKFIRQGDVLVPATRYDLEELHSFKNGSYVDVSMKSSKGRSIQMHRMYWALIGLATDYWEPKGGFISKCEKEFARGLSEYVKSMGHDASSIELVMRSYMESLIAVRKAHTPDLSRSKQLKQMHDYVKEECGYYDLIMTPGGLVKKVKSISFHDMSHEQWMEYYPKASRVVWNIAMCKVYKTEKEMHEAIDRLLGFVS